MWTICDLLLKTSSKCIAPVFQRSWHLVVSGSIPTVCDYKKKQKWNFIFLNVQLIAWKKQKHSESAIPPEWGSDYFWYAQAGKSWQKEKTKQLEKVFTIYCKWLIQMGNVLFMLWNQLALLAYCWRIEGNAKILFFLFNTIVVYICWVK